MVPAETLDLDGLEILLTEAIRVAVDHFRDIAKAPVVPQIPHDTLYDLIPQVMKRGLQGESRLMSMYVSDQVHLPCAPSRTVTI
jgi:hypothetical protein